MRIFVLLMLLFGGLGCGVDGSPGAMSQVSFGTDCGPGDESCLMSGLEAPLAVGASLLLDLDLKIQGSAALEIVLLSANQQILEVSGRLLTGRAKGVVALLVTDSHQEVLDFVHLWVEPAIMLSFHRLTEDGLDLGEVKDKIQMLSEQQLFLETQPRMADGVLLGSIPVEWSVDSEVVTLLNEGLGGRVRVVARKAGAAKISATGTGLDLDAAIDIEVLP